MVRLSCGVQARTDALLFRTDCTRLPDRTALGSTTAELGRRVLRRKANGLHLHTFWGCMLSSLFCELTALWACEKVTPAVAVLLLTISLLTLCLAAPVNDVNIHFDSDEMQALRGGMQNGWPCMQPFPALCFVCPQVFGILSASACIIALCVLLARMGLGITVIQMTGGTS